ncbi:MAG TPA: C45 family peptidase [Gaiellales bacterium]|jgi:isopenicillin-N N-acyltransferase-like protein|nr:C45 family peptidase [Gaiellales bacterium]
MSALAEKALATLRTDAVDPRERGRVAGAALAERSALCLAAYLPLFADLGHDLEAVRRFGERVLERVEGWHSPLADELAAFAAGARLEPELVAALNGRTELLALAECTTVGRCESQEGPWLAQNWDWYADAPERCVVWSAAVEGGRFATMTEAGILAKVGVSTRGVAVALNILYHASDGRGELGVPVHLVLRRLLGEAGSVDEAWALLRETPYSASSCITVVDAEGGGACFELSPAGVARVEPRDGLLAHTNHFLDERLARDEAEQPEAWMPGSRARLATAEHAAPALLADAIGLLGDHTSDPQAVCRHDEPPGEPGRPLVDTVVSLAMRPGMPELRVAAGQPCECAFLSYAI